MLRLVGSDEGYSEEHTKEEDNSSREPAAHTDSQLRKLAGEFFVQLPELDDEAIAVAEHLLELARWRAGRASEIKRVERARAHDDASTKMLVVLTHSAMEERLSSHGFTSTASNYAARVIRGGVLAPKHFKA